MKIRNLILAASLLSSFTAAADILGVVVDSITNAPIDFAGVTLLNPATLSPLQIGTFTDDDGSFTIRDVASGSYVVRISHIGSVTKQLSIAVGDSNIDLGRILLSENVQMLHEVVVTGQKSQVNVSAEKRVFNVKSNIASAGASATELLAAVPSVDVSPDGEISLRGNSDVTVLINGKPAAINADNRAQILGQLPAATVRSIEVTTTPDARQSTEGTAGIINIILLDDHRHGFFGSADAGIDSHGSANINVNASYNEGRFETFAALGLKSEHTPGGGTSRRTYDDGSSLTTDISRKANENSITLRLGTNFRADARNTLYISAIGMIGHKWSNTSTRHTSDMPLNWATNRNLMRESGNNRGINILTGYKHSFAKAHNIDINFSYNAWKGPENSRIFEESTMPDGAITNTWQSQHRDITISNIEAAVDYTVALRPEIKIDAGFKGNYNHENSPASYFTGSSPDGLVELTDLYNRFKYDTDISAIYVNLSGSHNMLTYAAGLRTEAWQIRTQSLGWGESGAKATPKKQTSFAAFPSASIGIRLSPDNELRLSYARRIKRPYGPQLNTFENISDPAEVHIGNPLIQPEYSNILELLWLRTFGRQMFSSTAFLRTNSHMISHISFLAPMALDPQRNTMYYGHANVGNLTDLGLEIISRNEIFSRLTLTTTLTVADSRLRAWTTEYPLHGQNYSVSGRRRHLTTFDFRIMASLRLPYDLTFQATGRYNSRRITAQGTLEPMHELEAGLRKNLGNWSFTLLWKDILDSRESRDRVFGNGYTQEISSWNGGSTLRLSVSYNFGKAHSDDDHRHNHIDTGGYGATHSH